MVEEKPAERRAVRVSTSSPRNSACGSADFTLARKSAMRALSAHVPMGANVVDFKVFGRRNGSPTTVPFPLAIPMRQVQMRESRVLEYRDAGEFLGMQ